MEIGIPHGQRPQWEGGPNAGPHLTNRELAEHGLARYRHCPFDEVWFRAVRGYGRPGWARWLDRWLWWVPIPPRGRWRRRK